MAKTVVHPFEQVEIDEQHAHRVLLAPLQRLVHPVLEQEPVGQSGESVVEGLVTHAFEQLGRPQGTCPDVRVCGVQEHAGGIDLDILHPGDARALAGSRSRVQKTGELLSALDSAGVLLEHERDHRERRDDEYRRQGLGGGGKAGQHSQRCARGEAHEMHRAHSRGKTAERQPAGDGHDGPDPQYRAGIHSDHACERPGDAAPARIHREPPATTQVTPSALDSVRPKRPRLKASCCKDLRL